MSVASGHGTHDQTKLSSPLEIETDREKERERERGICVMYVWLIRQRMQSIANPWHGKLITSTNSCSRRGQKKKTEREEIYVVICQVVLFQGRKGDF